MKVRLAIALVILAALSRLLPHPPNFTSLGAIGLFGAAYFQRRWMAVVVPFAALFLSDLLLNNIVYRGLYPEFTWITSGWIYVAFALVIFTGWVLLRQNTSPQRIVAASLTASFVFFLVSNFSVWASGILYPKTMAGLVLCYTAGLPYLGNTILGDLFFSAVLFGGYAWVSRHSSLHVVRH